MFCYHVASLKAECEAGIIPDIDQWIADKMLDQRKTRPAVVEAIAEAAEGLTITKPESPRCCRSGSDC
jgi:hypothetical protein